MKGKTLKKKRKLSRLQQKGIIKFCLDPGAFLVDPYPQSCIPIRRPQIEERACNVHYKCLTEDQQEAICTDPIQTLTRGRGMDSFIDKFLKKAKEIIPSLILKDFVEENLRSVSNVVCRKERESVNFKRKKDREDLRYFLERIKASNHKNGINLNTHTSEFFEHKQTNKPFESERISLSATSGLPRDSHLLSLKLR